MENYIETSRQLPLFEPLDEASLYLPPNGGYFALLTAGSDGKKHQKSYPISELETALQLIDPRRDSWISQAIFWTSARRVANVKSLSLSFLDIDYYKADMGWSNGKTPEQVAENFMQICDVEGIPRPSLVIHSGRGIQPKWLYENSIPRLALPRWNAVEKELVRKLQPYGVDSAVRDAARVLRIVQTTNSRSGTVCRIVGMTPGDNGKPKMYGFDNLCEYILPHARKQQRIEGVSQEQERKKRSGNGFTLATLNWARLEDLRTLVRLRGGVDEGMRMKFLMYTMNFLALSGQVSAKSFYAEAAVIAREIDPSWSFRQGDLRTVFEKMIKARAGEKVSFFGREVTPLYTPKTETLIDVLGVTSEEMEHLTTIIDDDVRRRRNANAQTNVRRAAGAVSRQEYEAHAAARKERAKALRSQGMSIRAIAEEMGLSVGAVSGYCKQ